MLSCKRNYIFGLQDLDVNGSNVKERLKVFLIRGPTTHSNSDALYNISVTLRRLKILKPSNERR